MSRASELAESWINGNRSEVVRELGSAELAEDVADELRALKTLPDRDMDSPENLYRRLWLAALERAS